MANATNNIAGPRFAMLFGCWLVLAVPVDGDPAQNNPGVLESRARAIFGESCLQCHGVLKTSGLDLRTKSSMLSGGKRGKDIIPGAAAKSRLYRVVSGLEKLQMPPARRLDSAQVQAIKSWIDSGASWTDSRPPESPY